MRLPTSKRLQEIVHLLEMKEYVKAKELAEIFQVSMETIRKDLLYLEAKGVVKKEYGGATLAISGIEKNLEYRTQKMDEKTAIARYAATLLIDQHVLILDAGTTCLACTKDINRLPSMDIVTNSVAAYEKLNGDLHNVFLTGGKKREKNHSLIGNWTERFLKDIHADICLLGTSGILGSAGPTAHSYQELTTKQAMIQQSDLVYLLADSSKFQEKGFHTVIGWEAIDGIITDHHLSPKLYAEYSKKVPIYMAEEEFDEEDR